MSPCQALGTGHWRLVTRYSLLVTRHSDREDGHHGGRPLRARLFARRSPPWHGSKRRLVPRPSPRAPPARTPTCKSDTALSSTKKRFTFTFCWTSHADLIDYRGF